MENKELKIVPPKGYEIDKDNSTFDKIVFKEIKKTVTYNDIADNLFYNKDCYFYCSEEPYDLISKYHPTKTHQKSNVATTREQLESILALNKLCNVAKYLNGDWSPKHQELKYFIQLVSFDFTISVASIVGFFGGLVYFKSKELAEQAIEILGEKEIIKALTLNH